MRSAIFTQRHALSPTEVIQKSDAVLSLLKTKNLIEGTHIALYMSHRHEVMAERLLPWLIEQHLQCYLPVMNLRSKLLVFVRYDTDTPLQPNHYGILEPIDLIHTRAPEDLDTIIMPLVAFTPQCERLGTGGGYYDTTLAFLNHSPRPSKPKLIGLAYDFQMQPDIYQHPHDVRLNNVVTETRGYDKLMP